MVEFKKHITGTYILYNIVSKFSYKKKLSPVVLLIVDKSSNIDFYNIISLFGLVISLWMKSSEEFSLDFEEII